MRARNLLTASILVLTLGALGWTTEVKFHAVKSSPSFDTLKSLAGKWQGTTDEAPGKAVEMEFRVVADGSAVMLDHNESATDSMVTLFHPDGARLLATHYCSAHNQPRMKLVSSDPKKLKFAFLDATNLPSLNSPHMHGLTITVIDADHQVQEWNYMEYGKLRAGKIELHRVK
jgi:hypothetical protein